MERELIRLKEETNIHRGRNEMKNSYQKTIYACFTGYVVQAIVNNFVPLLFLTFHATYGISLSNITILVTVNFGIQLLVDLASIVFVDKIGYRSSAVLAHVFAAVGFLLLTILPGAMDNSFLGLLIAVSTYAVGGGLLEVLVSPIVEACPTDHKEKAMSLLHSFYCWGHVGVVLLSTAFFFVFGTSNWKVLALLWAIVPMVNAVAFCIVPIAPLLAEEEQGIRLSALVRSQAFWMLIVFMVCAGASEQAVSQWASTFAEKGLGVTKAVGDLAGPLLFAVMMGLSRAYYGKFGERIHLERFMGGSILLCIASYLLIGLCSNPVLGFLGCGLCGFSVGILWPGTFSMAAVSIRGGGTAMYALLALAGDLGCSGGPTFVGKVSAAVGDDLRKGILMAVVFPVVLGIGMVVKRAKRI